jgi:hypothetical protein
MHRIPKGWYSAEPKTVGLNARYRFERRFRCNDLENNRKFDITAGHAAELGNVRSSLGLHATARVGWGLSGFPTAVIPTVADRSRQRVFEAGAILGFEGRGILNSALVQESPGSAGFSLEPFVLDRRWGFYVRYDALRITYQLLRRSAEFSVPNVPERHQDFASISVGFEPSLTDVPKHRSWLFREWQFELGMGTNFAGPKLDSGNARGITGQLVARKGLAKGFNLGLIELSSATVEGAPTRGEPGNRSDIILRQRAVTLGWGTGLNQGKAGRIAFRAGSALWGGNARIETVFHQPENARTGEQLFDRDFKAPRGGWLAGAQYFSPMERHLSIGVDVAYHAVKLAAPGPGIVTPRFLTVVLAAQLRP